MKVDKDFRVNALVIGAGRSGTTSLCNYLAVHREVCFSSIKEVHYFSVPELYSRGENYYTSFFTPGKGVKVVASSDTYLLIDYDAIRRIHAYNPEMKIIAILRDPVERAYSSYNYSVGYGHHDPYPAFLDSMEREKGIEELDSVVDRNNRGHFYAGLYHRHLIHWVEAFGKEQVLLLATWQMKSDPGSLEAQLSSFLGIEASGSSFGRENKSAVPRFGKLEHFLLDREAPLRRFIRNSTPEAFKRVIFRSGLVDHIHKANRKTREVRSLDQEEYRVALNYFNDDLASLEKDFGIRLLKA